MSEDTIADSSAQFPAFEAPTEAPTPSQADSPQPNGPDTRAADVSWPPAAPVEQTPPPAPAVETGQNAPHGMGPEFAQGGGALSFPSTPAPAIPPVPPPPAGMQQGPAFQQSVSVAEVLRRLDERFSWNDTDNAKGRAEFMNGLAADVKQTLIRGRAIPVEERRALLATLPTEDRLSFLEEMALRV